jgi:hypothetical protein
MAIRAAERKFPVNRTVSSFPSDHSIQKTLAIGINTNQEPRNWQRRTPIEFSFVIYVKMAR